MPVAPMTSSFAVEWKIIVCEYFCYFSQATCLFEMLIFSFSGSPMNRHRLYTLYRDILNTN